MPIDEEPLQILARQLTLDEKSRTETARDAMVRVVMSAALPLGIGSCLSAVLSDLGNQRWQARVADLLNLFAERIAILQSQIVSSEFFRSEDFQALLLEAIDQEKTNQYLLKRKMLAQGLAQSGTARFLPDSNKETFFRILRDLSPADIGKLESLRVLNRFFGTKLANCKWDRRNIVLDHGTEDPILYRLQGLGLAIGTTEVVGGPDLFGSGTFVDQGGLNANIIEALSKVPRTVFTITEFGSAFLDFLT